VLSPVIYYQSNQSRIMRNIPKSSKHVGPSHKLQFFTKFSSMDSFHMSFPWGAVLQEQTAPAWVPHGVASPASKPAPAWAHLPTGPQVLSGAHSSVGFPQGHSLLWASICSGLESSPGCRWIAAPPWTSMGRTGTACLTMAFAMGCRGISALAPGAAPLLSSPLTFVSAELFLSHILTLLSGCRFFFTFS